MYSTSRVNKDIAQVYHTSMQLSQLWCSGIPPVQPAPATRQNRMRRNETKVRRALTETL